ncbi:MAG: hypothetical protein PHQ60_04210 [Sideroxydans sp.]|nr:hypothetical protein [Sideroxydans sp.]
MLASSTALPLAAQLEVNETTCGEVTGTPPLLTVTETLVVPKAERGAPAVLPAPSVIADIVSVDAPIEYPIDPVTATELTCAVAVIVVAPEEEMVAGVKVTEAIPEALVSAEPPTGDMVVKTGSVTKVTTVLGTAVPVASKSVALTVPGLPVEIDVVVVPTELTRTSVREEAAGAVVVPVPVPVPVPVVPPVTEPAPQPERNAAVATAKVIKAVRFKNVVCKAAPSSKNPIRTIANLYERHSITLGFKSATIIWGRVKAECNRLVIFSFRRLPEMIGKGNIAALSLLYMEGG